MKHVVSISIILTLLISGAPALASATPFEQLQGRWVGEISTGQFEGLLMYMDFQDENNLIVTLTDGQQHEVIRVSYTATETHLVMTSEGNVETTAVWEVDDNGQLLVTADGEEEPLVLRRTENE